MVAIVMNMMMYVYVTFYNAEYDIPLWENIKLSFISVFLSFKQFLLTMFALFGVLALTWQYKGLYLFLTFGLLVLFLHQVTQPNRQLVHQMFEADQ
ncbi:Predicted integral membrane protein [Chlamydia trachomatis]|nr:Predicted integral membrane protein [Chlamydia trachomatis]